MIITVSMNPSVDKLMYLSELKPGFMNRLSSSSETAGGKGINVANVLAAFTDNVVLTGFVGNKNNEIIDECVQNLINKGITVDFVTIDGRNRTNHKIIEKNGQLTELNEAGFSVTPDDIALLKLKLLNYAKPDNIFILTGSVPKGVDSSFYAEITSELKKNGAIVYADASGEPLKHVVDASPAMIKPNQDEILELFSERNVSEKLIIKMARSLCEKGIETVIVSRGQLGALFVTKDVVLKSEALPVKVRSTVGAGDSMIASYAYAKSIGMSLEDCAKLCIAAATYTVTIDSSYLTEKEGVSKLLESIKIVTLDR